VSQDRPSALSLPRLVADGLFLLEQTPEPEPETPADAVLLPESMLHYACNQQGCCCRGWRIPFRPRDLVRLGRALPAEELPMLTRDVEVRDTVDGRGERVIADASVTDDEGACRLLADDGKQCRVHARSGVAALPDVCVDFPVAAYQGADAAELFYDPVCPSVLDALADFEARPTSLPAPYRDEGLKRRASHARPFPDIRFGVTALDAAEFDRIRRTVVGSLAASERPVLEHLLAIDSAYAEVGRGDCDARLFSIRYDRDPSTYLRFLRSCTGDLSTSALWSVFQDYRRFLFADSLRLSSSRWTALEKQLQLWEPAAQSWSERDSPLQRSLELRYLAHRHFTPFFTIQSRLRFAAGAVVHVLATARRYAMAFCRVLDRPLDSDILKASLGTAEYVYRSLEIPPESLPWFGLSS
jgi:hypothetical protein